ncbi:DUF4368 domain-containing protein, partial [Lachnospiraceae bacterium]|nr:DUF4368 domain-containing protein [Lachnospiraceae bacterium]
KYLFLDYFQYILLATPVTTLLYHFNCRLSQDDGREGESNSIVNQKEYLLKYAKEHGFPNPKFYVDDGYTGTNFDRPSFKEMSADIEKGIVKTVIVKDLSRFGRNYIEVGSYSEIIYPEAGVRFIAIMDNVDTGSLESNEFAAFTNLFNEWYPKSTSKKVKEVKKAKGLAGEHLGAPPYGYLRNPDDKTRWLVDEEAAEIVRRIFSLCMQGYGPTAIADMLWADKVLTPSAYKVSKGIGVSMVSENPYNWHQSKVVEILEDVAYIGTTESFKSTRLGFKSKKRIPTAKDRRAYIENAHTPIIDREVWDKVQVIRQGKRRRNRTGSVSMFSGLLYCADCGAKLNLCVVREKPYFRCAKYKGNSRNKECTQHYIREDALYQLVLKQLQHFLSYLQQFERVFIRRQIDTTLAERRYELSAKQKQIEKDEKRIDELDRLFRKIYEDNVNGKLNDERFYKLSDGYEAEQEQLKQEIETLTAEVSEADMETTNVAKLIAVTKKYTRIDELTPEILNSLVDKIIIHEREKKGGTRTQEIDIYYSNVGIVDIPTDEEMREMEREYMKRTTRQTA